MRCVDQRLGGGPEMHEREMPQKAYEEMQGKPVGSNKVEFIKKQYTRSVLNAQSSNCNFQLVELRARNNICVSVEH